jgi:hypothetical protein
MNSPAEITRHYPKAAIADPRVRKIAVHALLDLLKTGAKLGIVAMDVPDVEFHDTLALIWRIRMHMKYDYILSEPLDDATLQFIRDLTMSACTIDVQFRTPHRDKLTLDAPVQMVLHTATANAINGNRVTIFKDPLVWGLSADYLYTDDLPAVHLGKFTEAEGRSYNEVNMTVSANIYYNE